MGNACKNCFMGCCCYNCFLDSYLHIHIRTLKDFKVKGDINIHGTSDLYIRANYMGIIQETKVKHGEKGSVVFEEPLIFENGVPTPKEAEIKLLLQVYDRDKVTSDDLLARCEIEVPHEYVTNIGEKDYQLFKGDKVVGSIAIDQIHFIKQKLIRYKGPCKCCCCCLCLAR